ncbi:MAG TPA: HNH endonuclease, partial [Candidatus Eisenbacteria bacterium]|nr:HNH endonuclease [Candidatus Eisenbacteria bacterium]
MRDYSLTHLRDDVLLRDLAALIVEERGTMAVVLAHLAEVDARKLFAPLGYSSMFAYCVEELKLTEDAAYKRIQAARAARQFPILFTELAEGRLHLTAVCLLAPHLTEE